jgi:DedD protein
VERSVKERLVGAVVLMAAAIILIPEMLSGPSRDADEAKPATQHPEGAIKTYTIDLSQSPGASAATSGGDNRSPPPEVSAAPPTEVPPAQVAQANPEVTAPAPTTEKPSAAPEPTEEPPPPPVVESAPPQPAPSSPRAETPTPKPSVAAQAPAPLPQTQSPPQQRPLASAPAAPTSGSWAVQLGSFSKQATAEKLASEWRGKGQDAFVMPVKSGGATLYRVRIGPMKDRAGAESTLRIVKASIPGATVVAHP